MHEDSNRSELTSIRPQVPGIQSSNADILYVIEKTERRGKGWHTLRFIESESAWRNWLQGKANAHRYRLRTFVGTEAIIAGEKKGS